MFITLRHLGQFLMQFLWRTWRPSRLGWRPSLLSRLEAIVDPKSWASPTRSPRGPWLVAQWACHKGLDRPVPQMNETNKSWLAFLHIWISRSVTMMYMYHCISLWLYMCSSLFADVLAKFGSSCASPRRVGESETIIRTGQMVNGQSVESPTCTKLCHAACYQNFPQYYMRLAVQNGLTSNYCRLIFSKSSRPWRLLCSMWTHLLSRGRKKTLLRVLRQDTVSRYSAWPGLVPYCGLA